MYHGTLNVLLDKFSVEEGDQKKAYLFRAVAGLAAYPVFSIAERQPYTKESPVEAANALVGLGVPSLYNGFITHYAKEFASEMLYRALYEAVKAQLS